ncbi:hypothetical protein [Campylobacter sp. MG1]|uniref:hypothetical protein n=1 Tax=Campylobacter sp. MG1 TaxID=2976332 RepID=UPI00226D2C9E|nr:hypothetical protein [Campylobacter sp. MG1]
MFKKIIITILIFDLILCLYFYDLGAFYTIQLSIIANLSLPYLTFINLKKKLPKFVLAQKPRILLQNQYIDFIEKKGFKATLSGIKHYKIFLNLYKVLTYIIFAILIMILMKYKLFHITAFFIASFIVMIILFIFRLKNV